MNKLNKIGNQMLEYKMELNKDYPPLVINSLLSSIEKLAIDGVIDVDTHYSLKESDVSYKDLEEMLLTKTMFLKTHEELFIEYEEIREVINNILGVNDDNSTIKTLSVVANEKIAITKEFIITKDFINNYFYVESENDFEIMMKRKGFIEKFAILRLDKILRDFIKQKEIQSENYDILSSNVFFEADRHVYGIYLLFNIPIDKLDNEENTINITKEIKNVCLSSQEFFENKMTI